jgi:hypothetical protein
MKLTRFILCWAYLSLGGCHQGNSNSEVSSDVCQPEIANAQADPSEPQFVFPDGLADYKAGTVVLQPETGKVYRCKRFPYSGYCRQWSPDATMFEPGTGSNWVAAWELQASK